MWLHPTFNLKERSPMEKANIAYKYRIYPTPEQSVLFAKTFGCCRKVYNLILADKIDYYKQHRKGKTFTPAMYKDEYSFLREVDSLALSNEQLHVQTAFKNFFEQPKVGFPKFKAKHRTRHSYTTNMVNGNIRLYDNSIRLPKVGVVKAKIHRRAPENYKLKAVTVSQEKDGTYYASVLYEYGTDIPEITEKQTLSHVGLDYKSDGLYVDSNGVCCDMPHFYRDAQKKLAKAQRRLSRMTKGSKNYEKQRRKVAKISRHVANQRKDFLHKKSAEITNLYDIISVENLNMKAISQSLKLGKATYDNGFGMFCKMLAYKQQRKGHFFVKVGKTFPSSQLCQCGYKNPATKDLNVRTITCPVCGRTYDRDINAARNIDKEGLRLLPVS